MDFDAVRAAVEEVVEAPRASDPMEHLIVRLGWPAASCENVSADIAVILEDRGLGGWIYVQRSRPGETNSHAWHELRNPHGETEFSIDRTLQ